MSRPISGSPMPVMSLIASVDHDRADRRAQHAQHAALGARRHHARRRRLGVEVAVLRALLGPEHRHLALEAVDGAPHVRLAEDDGGVVDEVARGEVVGAVEDEVVVGEDLEHVVVVEPDVVLDDLHVRVDLGDRGGRGLDLGPADVGLPVDDLALQVRLVDDVVVDDAERADAGGGEVEQRRAAEAARADDEHLGVLEPLLAGHADVRDDEVPAVAADLVDRQFVGGFHEWGDHGISPPSSGNAVIGANIAPTVNVPSRASHRDRESGW